MVESGFTLRKSRGLTLRDLRPARIVEMRADFHAGGAHDDRSIGLGLGGRGREPRMRIEHTWSEPPSKGDVGGG